MTSPEPQWKLVGIAMAGSAVLFAFVASPGTALYWYIWPLFGLGGAYLVQFRSELDLQWVLLFAGSAVLSSVALAEDWPFSGHILWNIFFMGHAGKNGKRRGTWMSMLAASLLYLFVVKAASQTRRDLVGGFISVGVAAAVLALNDRVARRRAKKHGNQVHASSATRPGGDAV